MDIKFSHKALEFTVDEYLSDDVDLPHKLELVDGVIGPFSDRAKRALLANWGTDKVLKLTGADVWREAIESIDRKSKDD